MAPGRSLCALHIPALLVLGFALGGPLLGNPEKVDLYRHAVGLAPTQPEKPDHALVEPLGGIMHCLRALLNVLL